MTRSIGMTYCNTPTIWSGKIEIVDGPLLSLLMQWLNVRVVQVGKGREMCRWRQEGSKRYTARWYQRLIISGSDLNNSLIPHVDHPAKTCYPGLIRHFQLRKRYCNVLTVHVSHGHQSKKSGAVLCFGLI